MVGACTDVTAHREAEETLTEVMRELKRSNEDLEHFAYVASHDLQEPLRKVRAFGDRLLGNHAEMLDDKGRDYLRRMSGAAERMQGLIDDVLVYSRVTTRRNPPQITDLNELVNEVVVDLQMRLESTRGKVHAADLPQLEVDPTQMRQLFMNLISNSLKFHRPGVPPVVTIAAEQRQGSGHGSADTLKGVWTLTVSDNGIGFEEKYAVKVFEPFRRLHARSEYEGTGMGLAICRKIANRHGGDISAESVPGRGTCFTITLPASRAAGRSPG
jgi:signal transduction histidine kinase